MNLHFSFLVAYLLTLLFVSLLSSRRIKTQEDFSVAGRSLNTFVLFGTLLATWIGTGSIFGNAEKVYRAGIAALIIPAASLAGICILYLLAGRARGLRGITIQDLLEKRYNAGARVLGSICLIIAYTTIVSYQYRAAGAILNLTLPGLPLAWATLLISIFIALYTCTAGMLSIAKIGVIQGITMIVGIAIALPILFFKAGGLEGMAATLPPSHFDLLGPIPFWESIGILLPSFLLILGDANMYQRFFSARNEGTARKAVLWMLFGVAFMEIGIILTAWVASSLEPNLVIHGRVIAFAAKNHLPALLGAFMLTTIMAIILSTAGSYLLAPATCLVRDIYQRFINTNASEQTLVLMLRWSVIVLGAIAYLLSLASDEFLTIALLAYTIYGAGITPALIAAFYWRRATSAGAMASILSGTVVTLFWHIFQQQLGSLGQVHAVIPAIVASVTTLVFVSLLTDTEDPAKINPFFAESDSTKQV
jgi:SSS family solute:Na+ symporter